MHRPKIHHLFGAGLILVLALTGFACTFGPGNVPAETENSTEASKTNPDVLTVDRLRADFDYLYTTLAESHVNLYIRTPKEEYDAAFAAMRDDLTEPLTIFEATVRFQRFMALGHVAHSRIEFPNAEYQAYRDAGGTTVPFFLRVVDGRTWITEDYSGIAGMSAGDEVLALNGEPIGRWLDRLRRYISADSDDLAHAMLEFQLPLILWLELGDVESLQLTIRPHASTESRTLDIPMRSREEMNAQAALAPRRLELDWNGRSSKILDSGIGYLRPGPFYEPGSEGGYDPSAFRRFIDTAFQEFLDADTEHLLIDLRDNPGGDNSFSDLMIAWFADRPFRFCSAFRIKVSPATSASHEARRRLNPGLEGPSAQFSELYAEHAPGDIVAFDMPFSQPRDNQRFEGNVYVLINRHSFSNAVTVAALIQDYGLGRVLGEATTDLATSYGAMEHFELPNSGIRVGYPKAHIVRPNGDEDLRGVTPDVVIETPLLQPPEDPVLQQALEWITRHGARDDEPG